MSNSSLSRFMGGSPGQVVLRLVFLSFVVGVILAALDLDPRDLLSYAYEIVERIWNMGFDALGSLGRYFLIGAVIVVPVWVFLRIIRVVTGRS
ncbi:hypothetical protein GCM10011316_20890 [Roseibium aquae]|uniref:DUF6460 domain-containing protein n=1 Tax=Roseibium aquae TaxID=1323746 RepID=A0A916TKC5_9HYPH|nr:DUF6460 domain-containing protein [Roseibium aquae]GGB48612.1 hypothetical protein GCM10011316_20890 [Roseibium aquae]